jgi:hypothetical protein
MRPTPPQHGRALAPPPSSPARLQQQPANALRRTSSTQLARTLSDAERQRGERAWKEERSERRAAVAMEGEMAALQAEIQALTLDAMAGGGRRRGSLAGGRRGSVPDLRGGLARRELSVDVPQPGLVAPGPASAPNQKVAASYTATQSSPGEMLVHISPHGLVHVGPTSAPVGEAPSFPPLSRRRGKGDRLRRATAPSVPSPSTRPILPPVSSRREQVSTAVATRLPAGFVHAAPELTVEEDGWLVTKVQRNFGILTFRAATTAEAMSRGKHSAEFHLLSGVAGVLVGVGREWLDPLSGKSLLHTDDGWGFDACNGDLIHGSAGLGDWKWEGQQGCVSGDIISLELDCDVGTLSVSRNGAWLGIMVKEGLKGARTVSRDGGLVWVVQLARKGQAVRVKSTTLTQQSWPLTHALDHSRQQRRGSVPAVLITRQHAHRRASMPENRR